LGLLFGLNHKYEILKIGRDGRIWACDHYTPSVM